MKLSNNTVLITGGSAGIGFAIAKQLTEHGNHVIITGRNKERLEKAVAQLTNVTGIVSDVADEKDVHELVARLQKDFPQLNVVINNAGRAFVYSLSEKGVDSYSKASEEFHTNYLSVARLNEQLLPLLQQQPTAAIVNVTSIVAFAPNHILSSYSASKAALHSYSQSLRIELAKKSNVKVFELMPPLVNTDFSQDIGGSKGIPPSAVADAFIDAFQKDEYEIHVGGTADLYKLYLSSPAQALAALNG
ncbi:SDR family NAD(P)-dependent oxidoreductase [Pseudoflavitalea sp. X16]|uniref:SDR family oxidoreductase n=1 Tax=Paraflavitalea devenefica TaxID=2716334 RepID=UPI00141E54B5|nr:SDR family NAD(P)-dependent oxidoreductase [Paraflavitalea devenefica]NII25174.1 SDR family NAD(P)-dependent oxidoreductase [Paraflavitalea devenefica]